MDCPNHCNPANADWWERFGYHRTAAFGEVTRFACRTCGKTFSTQTFLVNYWAKRLVDYADFHRVQAEGTSVRALSRHYHVSPAAIQNRFDRLGRQMIALHTTLCRAATAVEDVCVDGFQSFDVSQYFPNNITLATTRSTLFVLEATHATLRRSGAMTEEQHQRSTELKSILDFEECAIERSFTDILDRLARDRPPAPGRPLILVTDEKLEYTRAFRKHPLYHCQDGQHRFIQLQINSRAARTRDNPLFAANYIDRELRKDQAAHRRETACHCRNVANGMMRLWCYLGWHNYVKKHRIKAPATDTRTHARMAGIARSVIEASRIVAYHTRAFLSRIELSHCDMQAWLKLSRTPLKKGRDYLPHYASG
jgi:transposase-like protein